MRDQVMYNLGALYGLAQRELPHVFDSVVRLNNAMAFPGKSIAEIHRLLLLNCKLTPQVDAQIGKLLDVIDPDSADFSRHSTHDQQCDWILGYTNVLTHQMAAAGRSITE